MAVSSLLLRALRLPPPTSSPSCSSSSLSPSSSSVLITQIHSHIGRRYFAQAVKLRYAAHSAHAKKKTNPSSTSWDEAASNFFASENENAENSSTDKESRTVEDGGYGSLRGAKKEYSDKGRVSYARDGKDGEKGRIFHGKNSENARNPYGRDGERGKLSHGKDSEKNGFSFGKGKSIVRDGSFSRKQFSDVGNDFDTRRMNSNSKVKQEGFREQFSDYNGVSVNSSRSRDRDQGSFRQQFSGRSDEGSFRERFSSRRDQNGFRDTFSDARGKGMSRNEDKFRHMRMTRNDTANNDSDSDDDEVSTNNGRGQSRSGFQEQYSDGKGKMDWKSGFQKRSSSAPGKVALQDKSRGTRFLREHFDATVEDDDYDDNLESDDEDEEEEAPQAGDVIRYNVRKRNPRGITHDDVEEEEEEEEENDESFQRRNSGWKNNALPSSGSTLPRLCGEAIYGVGPVYAALRIARRELFCLYVQANMPMNSGRSKRKDKKAFEWVLKSAIEKELEVKEISNHDLNMLSDNRPHQGLVLDASPLELINAISLDAPWGESEKPPVWVALDEVQDPQNFGAILRSAYFLGAKGVAVCAKNSAPLSAVVSKASAGALEVMELRSCKNMMKFLEISAKNGWRVVGATAAGPDVIPIRDLPRGVPTILVLGGEGKGLRTNVKMACNHFVCIPGLHIESNTKQVLGEAVENTQENGVSLGDDDLIKHDLQGLGLGKRKGDEDFIAVESLNVSVAAGILLHELLDSSPRAFEHSPRTGIDTMA